jgi:hypothetical protein
MMGAPGLNINVDGAAINPQILADLRLFGYMHPRIDLQRLDVETTDSRTAEVVAHEMQPVCIINDPAQLAAVWKHNGIPEVGNEADLAKFLEPNFGTFDRFLAVTNECVARAVESERKVFVGAMSNLTKHDRHRGLRAMERLPWHQWTSEKHLRHVGASIHCYAPHLDPFQPQPDFHSLDEAVAMFWHIVGPRAGVITETGLRDGSKGLTEDQVAERLTRLRAFFADHGFEIVIAHGINDGADPPGRYIDENHYGFRRLDGEWKPVARAFAA